MWHWGYAAHALDHHHEGEENWRRTRCNIHALSCPLDLTFFVDRPLSTTANVIYPTRHMRAVGERSREGPEEMMPPPSAAIKNECIRSLQALMRFMAKAWHLDLDEVVCEFVCDSDHKMWLVRVVRCLDCGADVEISLN